MSTIGTLASGRGERFQATTLRPMPPAMRAISRPMPPSPTTPSVLPRSSMPCIGRQPPPRTMPCMVAMWRAAAKTSAIACSATVVSP
jgi:hypothetical protein